MTDFYDAELEQTKAYDRIMGKNEWPKESKLFNDESTGFNAQTIPSDFLDQIKLLNQREWVMRDHLLRGYVSCIFAPGGAGKSIISLGMALSVATDRPLLGFEVSEQCNSLTINNEDDESELKRRIAGAIIDYKVGAYELVEKFHYISGYGSPLVFVEKHPDGTILSTPNVEALKKYITDNNIGVVVIDPFISTHNLNENDNAEISKVIDTYKHIAHKTRCAILLVHHTKKIGGHDSEAHAGDAEIGRGATALKDAARCVDTVARMSTQSAETLGFTSEERSRHIRVDTGKNNFGAPDSNAAWFRLESVQIPNGDYVGVPKAVNLKPLFEQGALKDKRKKWTAHNVAETIHQLITKDDTPFTEIKSRLMDENNVSSSQAAIIINMISYNENLPTTIKIAGIYFRYHLSKKSRTAPIMIHRREQ